MLIYAQALQMMGEGRSDFQGLFAVEPPPGGVYDPYAMTGTGTYVAPDVRLYFSPKTSSRVALSPCA